MKMVKAYNRLQANLPACVINTDNNWILATYWAKPSKHTLTEI